MVRTYKPKTDRSNIDEEKVKAAIDDVLSHKLSIRKAADKHNIKAATLQHRIEKFRKTMDQNDESSSMSYSSKYSVAQVFSKEQEKVFAEYLINCSKMHHGLTLQQLLTLAYQFADFSNCKYPESWKNNGRAGIDWAAGFRKRNQELSLRKPENTSAARTFAFNKTAVADFFNNYEEVLTRYKFTPDRIINIDETGITTVLSAPKVLAQKQQKQVGQIVASERGELVTFCGIITAIGGSLPPVFVFPRVHFKEHFLNGAPEGSLGLSNKSGWMTAALHLKVLEHIQRHTLCTKENPILVICDNHESHISIEAVNYCRDHGIVYLSLPPHTSHKLQPLDISVFGPFKGKLKVAFNDWQVQGKTVLIQNVAMLTKSAFMESFTPRNITSGFAKPGIWPFNRLAFSDDDFAPVEIYAECSRDQRFEQENIFTQNRHEAVTADCEQMEAQQTEDVCEEPVTFERPGSPIEAPYNIDLAGSPSIIPPHNDDIFMANTDEAPLVEARNEFEVSGHNNDVPTTSKQIFSPEVVRPYPKKDKTIVSSRKGKEKGKSRIFTDTPEKDRLQGLHDEKMKKQQDKIMRQRAKELKTAKKLLGITENKKKKKSRRPPTPSSETDCSLNDSVILSDDNEEFEDFEHEEENFDALPNPANIKVGDFLLIKFEKKTTVLYYTAKVISKYNLTEYHVSYLRKKPRSYVFVFPNPEDTASVDFKDVALQLPPPTFSKGTTARTASMYKFSIDLSQYNLQ